MVNWWRQCKPTTNLHMQLLPLQHISKKVWVIAVHLCLSLKSNTDCVYWFLCSQDIFKKRHPKQADLPGCYNFNHQWAAASGRKIGSYIGATVCKPGRLKLPHLHIEHWTKLSCSVSIKTTGATALLIQNIQCGSHSPPVATWLMFSQIIVFFFPSFFTLQSISLFSSSRTWVYSAGSLFEL